ncbi:MAG: hypothetical protein ACFCUR_00885 [Rhodomicrobiaceae bacterium]
MMTTQTPNRNAKNDVGHGRWALFGCLVLVAVFVANIASGKINNELFMSDVGEALTLFAAAILFVIGVVRREDAEKKADQDQNGRSNDDQEGTARA